MVNLNIISVAQALIDYDASTGTEAATIDGKADELIISISHTTLVFPEDTDETVTLTAGNTNNVFSAWAEVADNNAVTLSSKFTACEGHFSVIMTEDVSVKDKRYLLELAYGAPKTIISRMRYVAGNVQIGTKQEATVQGIYVPVGEKVYYRLKCETADATAVVHFRYHYH